MLRFLVAAFVSSASFLFSVPPSFAQADPSFDCRRASTASEGAICADPGLAGLDRALADAFRAAVSGPDGEAVRRAQRDWLARRDRCDADIVCLSTEMRGRIDGLRDIAATASAPVASPLRDVQAALAALGFYGGAVDGLDGPMTRQAIAAFAGTRADLAADAPLGEVLSAAQKRATRTVANQEQASTLTTPASEDRTDAIGWSYYSPAYATIDTSEKAVTYKLCVNDLWLPENSGFSPISNEWNVAVIPSDTGRVQPLDVIRTMEATAGGFCDWVAVPTGAEWPRARFAEALERNGLLQMTALMRSYRQADEFPDNELMSPTSPMLISKANEVGEELLDACSANFVLKDWVDCGCLKDHARDAVLSGDASRTADSYSTAIGFFQEPIPSACIGREMISRNSLRQCTEFNDGFGESLDCDCMAEETVRVFEADPRVYGSSGYDEAWLIASGQCALAR